jgi:hypothetical protein
MPEASNDGTSVSPVSWGTPRLDGVFHGLADSEWRGGSK